MTFENPYENMENVYEDLTVNQQQAEFQAQQGDRQRAGILGQLRGAAGASGIASLAQALANQQQLATQKISATIGAQEAMNQKLAAQGAGMVQRMERIGEEKVQQFEADRQATLLGMQMGATAGASQALTSANLAQQQAAAAGRAAVASSIGQGLIYQALIHPQYKHLKCKHTLWIHYKQKAHLYLHYKILIHILDYL